MPELPPEARMTDEQLIAVLQARDRRISTEAEIARRGVTHMVSPDAAIAAAAASEHTWPIAYAAGQANGWEAAATECTSQHLKWNDLEPALRGLVEAMEWALAAMDRGDSVLEYTGLIEEGDRAKDALAAAHRALEETG